ncbi:MAG: SMI1/KNR4 family protein [Cellulophaga sp.]|uniref:SMI1/KNR4 family protein n=1 Tax=Cellulophaga sp. TaxID=1972202 RepID=UPI0032633C5F
MPFPIEEKYIIETESELNVKFPAEFKNRMISLNGGEIEEVIENEEEDYIYWLYPFFDKSDKKRISRTCNHIGLETENSRKWENFPKNTIAIGHDGSGNKLVLIHNGNGVLSENLYFWDHETGEIEKIAESIKELDG